MRALMPLEAEDGSAGEQRMSGREDECVYDSSKEKGPSNSFVWGRAGGMPVFDAKGGGA